eukprot:4279286-Pyramimonas_sp.AAC.1
MSCARDGIWTRSRARSRGYTTDGKCKCGEVDTVLDRLVECQLPEAAAARADAEVEEHVLKRLRDDGEGGRL